LEGSIASVYGFVLTIFTSVASQIVGWLLKFDFINETFILLPGICLIGSAIVQYIYPINEKSFNMVKEALKAKKAGETPDLTGLERIL
jgi:Na+/melibiose symporter-like transporter